MGCSPFAIVLMQETDFILRKHLHVIRKLTLPGFEYILDITQRETNGLFEYDNLSGNVRR